MFSSDDVRYLASVAAANVIGATIEIEEFETDEGEPVMAFIGFDGEAFLLIQKTVQGEFVFTDRDARVVGRHERLSDFFSQIVP